MLMILGLLKCSEPEKPKPEIASLDPTSGAIGVPVTVTGKNLATAQSVSFGNISSPVATKTETSVVTVVPPGLTPGDLTVTVKTDGGTSNTLDFTVLHSQPEITGITPDRGSVGMEVTLIGKYLGTVSSVSFGTKTVTTFVSSTDTQLKLIVPAGLALGALDVTVTTEGGTSEKATFTVVGKPTITSVTPAIGPAGTLVSIAGTHLTDASLVMFGAGPATFTEKTAALIEATVPVSATTGKVKVMTPGGEALSSIDFVVKDAPKITSFSPTSGIVGTVVTINGENFDAGNVIVKFGSGTAAAVTVVNATKITATLPASSTTGKITVQTAAGSGESAANFTVIGSPTLTSFSPASGGTGVEVTITGTNFISVNNIKYNATTVSAANYTVVSSTQIKAKVPSGASSGKISITTPSGTGMSGANFTVLAPPTIASFSPANGAQGSNVIITGTGFTSITAVSINDIDVGGGNFTVNSPTQITAKVPANATSGKIKVVNALGTATSSATFYVTPFITSINPASGNPGSTLTIAGTNLGSAKVRFNSTEVTPTANTANSISVTVPSLAPGAMNITVVNAGGTSNPKTFTITSPVVLTEIVATANIVEQLILLKGSNLGGATKVIFGTDEESVLTNTATVVTAIIPPSLSAGTYSVRVVTANGTSNGINLQVLNAQNPNTGGVSLVNGATVVAPPGGYVPPVTNQWDNNFNPDEQLTLSEDDFNAPTGTFTVDYSVDFNPIASGSGTYDRPNNYIEFTLSGVRYVGIWTHRTSGGGECFDHMTLISAESGKQLELTVQTFDDCP
jgi:hypothetical protein